MADPASRNAARARASQNDKANATAAVGERSIDPGQRNKKVMVYLPTKLHQAVRDIAHTESRTRSDVVAAAVRAYVAARAGSGAGKRVIGTVDGYGAAKDPHGRGREFAALKSAVEEQARAIELLTRRIDSGAAPTEFTHSLIPPMRMDRPASPADPLDASKSENAVARSERVIVDALERARPGSLDPAELHAIVDSAGLPRWAVDVCKSALRKSGRIVRENGRWRVGEA